MLLVTCYMQSVMCYMGLVTCYVKALLSMGKQGTKSFARDFFIGMGVRDFFARNSLGENGYFIGFGDFRPNFKLILHTSK